MLVSVKVRLSSSFLGIFMAVIFLFSSAASAHVVVKPGEVVTSGFQTFTVGAPNEKDIAFNEIKLTIPEGVKHVSPVIKDGWEIDVKKQGKGEDERAVSITWSGGSVPGGFREEFAFSAQAPAEATELIWKADQTYADGLVVSWSLSEEEQPKNDDGSPDFSASGPYSTTKIVSEPESVAALNKVETDLGQSVADAKRSSDRAFYVGILAVFLSVFALVKTTKK